MSIIPGERTLTKKYPFRYVFTPAWTGSMNMEADRYFGEISPPDTPLLRLYTWDRPTISFGCNQNPGKRIDLGACERDGIPVVQRPTGGRELLHGHDLCYGVAMPQEMGIGGIEARQVFAFITDCLVAALKKLGIMAEGKGLRDRTRAVRGPCFAQIDAGEITVGGKKLVASAQRVYAGCILQQGSIPLVRPSVDLTDYLCLENKDSLEKILELNTAYLGEHSTLTLEAIAESIKEAFEEGYSGPAGSGEELLQNFKGIIGVH